MKEAAAVWYVQGDPEGFLFQFKIDAETYARFLFRGKEDADKTYGRIYCRHVYTFTNNK